MNECSNYLRMSVIGHVSKLMLTIILLKWTSRVEHQHAEQQSGFRRREQHSRAIRSVTFCVRRTSDHTFLDFKKVFDMVWRIHHGRSRKNTSTVTSSLRFKPCIKIHTKCGSSGHNTKQMVFSKNYVRNMSS